VDSSAKINWRYD